MKKVIMKEELKQGKGNGIQQQPATTGENTFSV